jgi:hypothetical protein
MMSTQPDFVVVLKGSSGVRFAPDEPLGVGGFPSATGPVNLVFRTRYADEGFSAAIPRELWVDARGRAASLDLAIQAFASAANSLATVVALSANAPVDDLDVHIAYNNTVGLHEREFFESFLPDESGIPRQGRRPNVEATVVMLGALATHPEARRLSQAIGQYHLALANWRPGRETLALAHIYMGLETLTKAALSEECGTRRLTPVDLAAEWGVEKRQLDPEVRRRILFQGDEECYKLAKQASDGLEHGFMPYPQLRGLALRVRDRSAAYLRAAILGLARVEEKVRRLLLAPPFDRPLESWGYSKYVRGRLLGTTDELAEVGQEYPILRWKSSVKSVSRNPSGDYDIETTEEFTASLGEGVTFQPDSYEVWGPRRDPRKAED